MQFCRSQTPSILPPHVTRHLLELVTALFSSHYLRQGPDGSPSRVNSATPPRVSSPPSEHSTSLGRTGHAQLLTFLKNAGGAGAVSKIVVSLALTSSEHDAAEWLNSPSLDAAEEGPASDDELRKAGIKCLQALSLEPNDEIVVREAADLVVERLQTPVSSLSVLTAQDAALSWCTALVPAMAKMDAFGSLLPLLVSIVGSGQPNALVLMRVSELVKEWADNDSVSAALLPNTLMLLKTVLSWSGTTAADTCVRVSTVAPLRALLQQHAEHVVWEEARDELVTAVNSGTKIMR